MAAADKPSFNTPKHPPPLPFSFQTVPGDKSSVPGKTVFEQHVYAIW